MHLALKGGMTYRRVRPLTGKCSARVQIEQSFTKGLTVRRNAQHFRSWLTPLHKLTDARREIAAVLSAVLQAVPNLLESIDLGGDESLDPAAFCSA
ncbi:hypothetical protein D3C73_1195840 [compost metagenome]